MKRNISRVLAFAALTLAAIAITSCTGKKFHVSGEIANAKDSVLYFENMSLDGPVTVDSVKLGSDGSFDFSQEAPQSPEFYRLRIAGQIINIAADSITSTNTTLDYATLPDVMTVVNTTGTFTASFTSGVLQAHYGSKAVPNGWLVPLTFIGIGRQSAPDEEIAKVRLIVPSTEGQSDAMNNVYACFYEITYQRGR